MTKSNSEKIIRQFHNMMAWTKKKNQCHKKQTVKKLF